VVGVNEVADGGAGSRIELVFDRALGNRLICGIGGVVSSSSLRVLAYHEIRHVGGFAAQMEHVLERYRPVSSSQVVGWLRGERLPARSVWVTFDDADPSVVAEGLPVLERLGIPATMFVCPGVVDTDQPYWWQIVEQVDPSQIGAMKSAPDDERRARTEEFADQLRKIHGFGPVRAQITSTQLREWVDSGRDVGNHTWDHPMLDRCSPEEQERQIRMAHEWLADHVGPQHLLFAYPNGNPDPVSASVLSDLGYELTALFDHRFARRSGGRTVSRLRTNADADLARFCAIASGIHPVVHRLRGLD
jgi:peptidoglycan/xylan/chitin deacetylase (PgdA/CDA1 family)